MKKTVNVIFTKDIDGNLRGDEKAVALGYARNFLFPQELALEKNDQEAAKLIKELKEERKKREKEIAQLVEKAQAFQDKEIVFSMKASATGKLFGSVTKAEIAKKLDLPEEKIVMEPIKDLGSHKVKIEFGPKAEATVTVIVNEEKTKSSK